MQYVPVLYSIHTYIPGTPLAATMSFMPALRTSLSFSGCGFLGIYHLGVARSLAQNGKRLLLNVQRYAGASAGALVASILAIVGSDLPGIEV